CASGPVAPGRWLLAPGRAGWPVAPGPVPRGPGPVPRGPGPVAPGPGSAAVEGIPQPREESLLAGSEPARRGLLATELGELPQQRLLLLVQLGGGLDRDVDDQVAAAGAVQVPHAQPVQRD